MTAHSACLLLLDARWCHNFVSILNSMCPKVRKRVTGVQQASSTVPYTFLHRYRFLQRWIVATELSTSGGNKRKQKAIKMRQGEEEFQHLSEHCWSSLWVLCWQMSFSNSILTSISPASAGLCLHCGYGAYMCFCAANQLLFEIVSVSRSKRLNVVAKHFNSILQCPGLCSFVGSCLRKMLSFIYPVHYFEFTMWAESYICILFVFECCKTV